jgi:gliding motility-associated-like protein
VNFIPNPYSGCQPLLVDFSDNTNIDGKEFYWSFGDGTSDTSKNPSHVFLDAGDYTVNHIVTNQSGCTGRIVVPQAVKVFPFPVADFTNTPEVTNIYAPNIAFIDGSSNTAKWEWDFGDHSGAEFNRNPEHSYKDTGMFVVRLISTSDKGCIDTTYGKVIIKGEFAFYIPNAFTPNNDGVNDFFLPLGIGVQKFEMSLYDRWGLLIFTSDDISRGWSGRTYYGDEYCPMDVYVYKIDIEDLQGKPHHYVGRVSLVR